MRYVRNAANISFTEEDAMILEYRTPKYTRLSRYGMGPTAMKKIKVCPNCGHAAKNTSFMCPSCRRLLTRKTLFDEYKKMHFCCPHCDIPLTVDTQYCPHCGKKVGLNPAE